MQNLRLPRRKEFTITLPSTHYKNLKAYKRLLPHFYYDWKTEKRINATLKHNTRPWKENYLDKYFNLNSQRRAFYKIPPSAEFDDAYKQYVNILTSIQDACELYDENDQFKPVWDNPEGRRLLLENPSILDYNTFVSNKLVLPNGTTAKLFKFLIKNKLLQRDVAEQITTKKQGMDKLYLCISRNPVDYLFASTGQPFTSCISLDSTYEEAAFMGLGNLCLDPNRVLILVTKGKVKNRTVKGHTFRYLRMVSRSWGIMYSNNHLLVVGVYPHSNVPYKGLLTDLGYQVPTDYPRKKSSLFNWEPPRYETGDVSTIYLDGGSPLYKSRETGLWRYDTENGNTGVWHPWDCGMNFEDIGCIDDLENGGMICCNCDGRMGEDYAHYADGDYYCEECFNEYWTSCHDCGDPVYREDAIYVEEEYDVCDYCYSQHYYECEHCNTSYHEDNMHHTEDGVAVCRWCVDDGAVTTCVDCDKMYYNNRDMVDTSHGKVCESCFSNDYSSCCECGVDYLVTHDGDNWNYCSDCYSERSKVA